MRYFVDIYDPKHGFTYPEKPWGQITLLSLRRIKIEAKKTSVHGVMNRLHYLSGKRENGEKVRLSPFYFFEKNASLEMERIINLILDIHHRDNGKIPND